MINDTFSWQGGERADVQNKMDTKVRAIGEFAGCEPFVPAPLSLWPLFSLQAARLAFEV